MDNLVAWLDRIDDSAIGTLVHVGAGSGAVLEQYAALPAARQPRQVILIEGDPDRAHGLEHAAAKYPWARVRPTPVAAQGGPIPWNRFNLPILNGPLDATGLTSVYPRLRRVQTTTVRFEGLADMLRSLALEPTGKGQRVHVLVLDVPGQEASLLAALPPELLRQFYFLLIRGCREVLPPSGLALKAVLDLLAGQHFNPVAQVDERDTLWPVALLRFDSVGHELAHLRQHAAEVAATLKERDRRLDDLQLEHEESIGQLKAQLAEASLRLELLQQEVTRAEGQLALLKELLLQEPSL